VQAAFNAAAQQLEPLKLLATEETRTFSFGVRIQPEKDVRLSGESILEVGLEGQGLPRLAGRFHVRKCLDTGKPQESVGEREITVEQFSMGETSIVHHNDRIAIDIDLSDVELPPLSQLRYFRVSSAEDLEHESFAITNPQRIRVAGHLKVSVCAPPETAEQQ